MNLNNHKVSLRLILPIVALLAVTCGIIGGRIIERRSLNKEVARNIEILREYSNNPQLFMQSQQMQSQQEANPMLGNDKLSLALALIEHEYVDSVSIDTLREHLMPHIFEKLDPHSVYIPASELADMNEPLEGKFDGVGIVFNMATDTVLVINVIPSGPSADVGIVGGDRIIEINDSLVAGVKLPQNQVIKRLRGKRGTKVKLGVERGGVDELIEFEVTRDAIPINSISSAIILKDSIGYIKMLQFARTTHSELVAAINNLKKQGLKGVILDLRGNSGGYLDQAILIANEFLPYNKLIVYTEDRTGERMNQYSDGRGLLKDMNIAVLIDEQSASSSEILAGALQDNDIGSIIGRRSFGKGLVQQQIPFLDGSAMRLTIARYYTPVGRSIQKEYGDSIAYEDDLVRRIEHNEFFVADSIHFADSLKFTTAKGKVVYGGGGIMPDIFVPADTTGMSKYFMEVSMKNILYNYTTKYADDHREKINAITTAEQLESLFNSYTNDNELLRGFVAYAETRGVKPVWSEIETSREIILAQLKAYIGRNTPLDDDAFTMSIYPIDNTILKAIETIEENHKPGQVPQ